MSILTGYAEDPAQYLDVEWIPPRVDWIDPTKDVAATKNAVRSGLLPQSAAAAANGYTLEQILDEAEALNKELDRRKVVFDTDARRTTNAGVGQYADPLDTDANPKTSE